MRLFGAILKEEGAPAHQGKSVCFPLMVRAAHGCCGAGVHMLGLVSSSLLPAGGEAPPHLGPSCSPTGPQAGGRAEAPWGGDGAPGTRFHFKRSQGHGNNTLVKLTDWRITARARVHTHTPSLPWG